MTITECENLLFCQCSYSLTKKLQENESTTKKLRQIQTITYSKIKIMLSPFQMDAFAVRKQSSKDKLRHKLEMAPQSKMTETDIDT